MAGYRLLHIILFSLFAGFHHRYDKPQNDHNGNQQAHNDCKGAQAVNRRIIFAHVGVTCADNNACHDNADCKQHNSEGYPVKHPLNVFLHALHILYL